MNLESSMTSLESSIVDRILPVMIKNRVAQRHICTTRILRISIMDVKHD